MTITVNTFKGLVPGLFPTGGIIAWGGASGAPPGWLSCDGTTVAQSLYKSLFNVIGVSYNTGGEPVGTFRLPNLVDKYLYGGNAVAYAGAVAHEHVFTTASTIANVASGDHSHNHGLGAAAMGAGGIGSHNHGGSATAGAGTSSSNANKGTGPQQRQPSGHQHSYGLTGINAANPGNHNHNSNTSSTSGNSGNHEATHYPNANISTRMTQRSYDAFGPLFNEVSAFNVNFAFNVRGIIKT